MGLHHSVNSFHHVAISTAEAVLKAKTSSGENKQEWPHIDMDAFCFGLLDYRIPETPSLVEKIIHDSRPHLTWHGLFFLAQILTASMTAIDHKQLVAGLFHFRTFSQQQQGKRFGNFLTVRN